MELAIPLVALGGLYFMSKKENFSSGELGQRGQDNQHRITGNSDYTSVPNTDIPNKNYPNELPVISQENELTSKLSTTNVFDSPGVYTDKYFNPNNNANSVGNYANYNVGSVGQTNSGNPSFPSDKHYYSLTGEKVDSNYFKHENMVPYFGGQIRSRNLDANSNEGILDNYQGQGSQIYKKSEQSPLFNPGENYNYAYGAPNSNDFYQSRVNPSLRMANVKPFEEQRVAPGLGLGYTTEGSGGYNSGMAMREKWLDKSVDDLRVLNHQKSSEHAMLGHEGPAISNITFRGDHAPVNKNGPDKLFNLGPERYFTTTGVEKAPTARAIPVERFVNRPETNSSYVGGAGYGVDKTYQSGEYMDSNRQELGEVPLGVATGRREATDGDYGIKSKFAYPNNRTANNKNDYYGAVGGAIGAVIAPLMDVLRPSRKENTVGNLRLYENAHSAVNSSYIFNPADRPAPTIRETTENNNYIYGANRNDRGAAYATTEHQPIRNERETTNNFMYTGGSSVASGTVQPRTYDAEYNQRNNDIKSATIDGRMVPGNMDLMNSDINVRNRAGEIKNTRPLSMTDAPKQFVSSGQMGERSTAQAPLYQNIQMDRNNPEILSAFRNNPYTHSLTNIP